MSRIPESELERIKSQIDLVALVQSKGIELKKHGAKDLIGRCPFHEEKTSSFIVTPSKNLFHCMGCGKGGTVIDFVMAHEGLSFRHAYEVLAHGDKAALLSASRPVKHSIARKLESPIAFDADDYTQTKQVIDYYHERLKVTPLALDYLHKRGITPEAIEHFRIGFADRTLGLRLPSAMTKAGNEIRERLKKIGLLREETGHEHFNGCVTFPIEDAKGNITEIYGRKVYNNLRPGTLYHLYLPGSHVGIFNSESLRSSREIILCESVIDALTFWCVGFRNVTCIYGTEGFTEELKAAFIDYKTQKVYIAYDRDEAGERASKRDSEWFLSHGIECFRVLFPSGMDANEYARKVTPSDKSLGLLIHSAQWLGRGKKEEKEAEPSLPVEEMPVASPESLPPAPSLLLAASSLAASAKASAATDAEEASKEKNGDLVFEFEGRSYRVRGLEKNRGFEALKINLRVMAAELFYVDTLDLYQARQRAQFIEAGAKETLLEAELIKRDLGRILLKLEERQEVKEAPKVVAVEGSQQEEALALLRDPKLLDHVLCDLHKCGLVGEENNLLVAWLVSVSRKLEKPLGVCVMSRSSAGKSSLLEAVGMVIPEEDRHQYTALTPQALFHMPENELRHKALFVAEDVGAQGAAYSLKTMQSDGQLIIACTMKDEITGQMLTKTKIVRGPLALFLTSTNRSIDDELLNRLLVLTIDESPEQTRRIHEAQRQARTLEGILSRKSRSRVVARQQNLQRLIRPLIVRNPFIAELSFNSTRLRSRRDNDKYLSLIDVMALIHQHQREIKTEIDGEGQSFSLIEVTREDITRVDRLMADVLDQTTDELTPASRRMLALLEKMENGTSGKLWTRREIREKTNWSDTQVRMVLEQLVNFEYLVQYGSGRGNLVRYGIYGAGSSQFAVSSQSVKCELPIIISASSLADKKKNGRSSHSLHGVQA